MVFGKAPGSIGLYQLASSKSKLGRQTRRLAILTGQVVTNDNVNATMLYTRAIPIAATRAYVASNDPPFGIDFAPKLYTSDHISFYRFMGMALCGGNSLDWITHGLEVRRMFECQILAWNCVDVQFSPGGWYEYVHYTASSDMPTVKEAITEVVMPVIREEQIEKAPWGDMQE